MSAIVKGMLGLISVNAVLGLVQLTNKQFGLVGCNWWGELYMVICDC